MSEKQSLVASTKTVGSCIAASRMLGFVRMIFMSHFFGTSVFVSAFFLAFQIPNMFRRLFGEGALSAAFVPVFTECIEKEGLESANRLAGKVTTLLTTCLAGILVCGYVCIALLRNYIALSEDWDIALSLMNIMLPYMFFICIVALFMGILNSRHHFFVPAAAPVLLNVVWIGSIVLICPYVSGGIEWQIRILSWSILFAGLLQLLVHLPALVRSGIKIRADFAWKDSRVHKILILMGPGILGMGLFQINTLIGQFMAFSVAPWAVSSLQYSSLIVYFPLGVFATSLGTVLLPTFSGQAARGEKDAMLKTLRTSITTLMFVMMPAAVGLGVMAKPIVQLIFEHGEFGPESTEHTVRALWFFSSGLVVFSLYKIFVPVFYSRKDTKTPAIVALIAVALNFLLMVAFVYLWPEGYKHAGIAFASVLSSGFSCIVFAVLIHRELGNPGWAEVTKSMGKSFCLAIVMGVIAGYVASIGSGYTLPVKVMRVTGGVIAGVVAYFAMASVFCKAELLQLKNR